MDTVIDMGTCCISPKSYLSTWVLGGLWIPLRSGSGPLPRVDLLSALWVWLCCLWWSVFLYSPYAGPGVACVPWCARVWRWTRRRRERCKSRSNIQYSYTGRGSGSWYCNTRCSCVWRVCRAHAPAQRKLSGSPKRWFLDTRGAWLSPFWLV